MGDVKLPLESLPHPAGNLAYNDGRSEFPKATASYHDRFGGVPKSAIDGRTNFLQLRRIAGRATSLRTKSTG